MKRRWRVLYKAPLVSSGTWRFLAPVVKVALSACQQPARVGECGRLNRNHMPGVCRKQRARTGGSSAISGTCRARVLFEPQTSSGIGCYGDVDDENAFCARERFGDVFACLLLVFF